MCLRRRSVRSIPPTGIGLVLGILLVTWTPVILSPGSGRVSAEEYRERSLPPQRSPQRRIATSQAITNRDATSVHLAGGLVCEPTGDGEQHAVPPSVHRTEYVQSTGFTGPVSDTTTHTCDDPGTALSCPYLSCGSSPLSPCRSRVRNAPACGGDMCCQPLLPCNRFSFRTQYLLWWSNASATPPLVTTSAAGTPPEAAGILNQPNTSIIFGGDSIDSDAHSGGCFTLDYWFDHCRFAGIQATYVGVGQDSNRFSAASDALPILARPYFDKANGAEAAMLIAHPDFLVGSVAATTSTEFQGVEVLFRRALMRGGAYHLDFVLGWRFARLDESLGVAHSSEWTEAQGPIVVGTAKDVFDLFDTRSQFHGAEFGVLFQECCGPWSLDLAMKLGLGNTRSQVFLDGQTVTTVPGAGSATFAGGLLAQETNMGRYSHDDFAVIPELGVTLGYNITCRLRLTFGYTFIYWSKVARPGDQIDRDVSQLPPEAPAGAQRPEFAFRTNDYWTQGMNFGLEYRF